MKRLNKMNKFTRNFDEQRKMQSNENDRKNTFKFR